jgi:hypothetical protein
MMRIQKHFAFRSSRPALTESGRVQKQNHIAIGKAMPKNALKISSRRYTARIDEHIETKRVKRLV